ncbi:MAG TPA: Wadjet anti-phage system protein JetD domain-containing protein [Kribbellaceae bacterium]|nr:Wadjet anti-phage system protein JetD domain-containing protein [Kribbellaceae bacterium]
MRQPDEVRAYLRDRFDRDYPDWARRRGTFPLRVPLNPPSTAERAADPIGCHAWADAWRTYPGPGTVVRTNHRFPTGVHPMPKTLVLDRPSDVAAVHPDTDRTWRRCGERLVALQKAFPQARFDGVVRRITDLPQEDYDRLAGVVAWLRDNPTSGMLLRQLPIEGIDTKWLGKQAHLVLAMLGDQDLDPDSDYTSGPRRLRLHWRLGLRVPPDLVQVAVLDPNLRTHLAGMRHFAASVDDLNGWPHHPRTVLILENKETGYALTDDHDGVVVLHGGGLNVASYARITWVRQADKVVYWGDIDAVGLQFVSDLRGHGVTITSVMTDVATLDRFHRFAVEGAGPQRNEVPNLTEPERLLYQRLVDHASSTGTGLLLEQERIPWSHAYPTLVTAIAQ